MVDVVGAVSGHAHLDQDSLIRTMRQPSTSAVDTGTQLILGMMYREAVQRGQVPSFSDVAFSNYSQTEEDGILWFLLSIVGVTTKRMVEIGAGDGVECNSANLVLNHSWDSLLVDGNQDNVDNGRKFLATRSISRLLPPHFVQSWVTRENVDELLSSNGFIGPIDVLSIDLDGIDYWVWEAITIVDPRIVVIEFNPCWMADASVTVPYAPGFSAHWIELDAIDPKTGQAPIVAYHGASLPAMVKMGRAKGYRLVGTNALGFNAFFIRDGLAENAFPEVDAKDCFASTGVWHEHLKRGQEAIASLPWETV